MRILSLAPSNTEILYALGVGDDVVGVTAYCDEPAGALAKPKVGGWIAVHENLMERFAPDLIVTSMFMPPEIRELADARPELFCHVEPGTLAGVYKSITTIGERVGRSDEAAAIIADMREGFEEVARSVAGRPPVKVYIEEWSKPPMVSGNWVPEVVRFAGVQQVIAKPGERSRAFDFAQLAKEDPAMIILSICGQRDRVPVQEISNRPEWGVLTAVQRDRVYVLDDSLLNRPGPRLVDGARALARIATKVLLSA